MLVMVVLCLAIVRVMVRWVVTVHRSAVVVMQVGAFRFVMMVRVMAMVVMLFLLIRWLTRIGVLRGFVGVLCVVLMIWV
jgi:hypothetical protein